MKRVLAGILLLAAMFALAACTDPSATEPTPTQAPTAPPTEAPTEAPTEPEVTSPATVTVYLLTQAVYFENGFITYSYDKNHNIHNQKTHHNIYVWKNTISKNVLYKKQKAINKIPIRSKNN